jgi:hypothetical protein
MAEKSLSFWKDHHNIWLNSEISINRYCIENKLIPSIFKRWISKIEPQVKPIKN